MREEVGGVGRGEGGQVTIEGMTGVERVESGMDVTRYVGLHEEIFATTL